MVIERLSKDSALGDFLSIDTKLANPAKFN